MKKRIPKISLLIILSLLSCFCLSCKMKNEKETYNNLNNIPDKAWEDLSKKSFYFGHQSVGYNIIDGIRDILKENPKIKLNIIETTDASAIAPGVFAHSRIGKNTQPKTKIDDFAKYINSGVGKKADTAAMKLCYVDINENADTTELFSQYEAEIAKIHKAYPNLTIVHFTAPLRTLQTGPQSLDQEGPRKACMGRKRKHQTG